LSFFEKGFNKGSSGVERQHQLSLMTTAGHRLIQEWTGDDLPATPFQLCPDHLACEHGAAVVLQVDVLSFQARQSIQHAI
jgi:hypothetical protein